MKKYYWMGSNPNTCNICGQPISKEFVDGKTTSGPWGLLCMSCHRTDGVGLGTGRGQKYEKQDDGRWLKVGG